MDLRQASRPSTLGIGPLLALTTLGRLALVPVILFTFARAPLATTVAIAVFIAADVHDGVLARRGAADGPYRRALDSVTDRIAIDACLVGAALVGKMPLIILCALLLRDAYCATICASMMRSRHVAIKADWVYKALNTSVAAWAVTAPFLTATARTTTAAALCIASLVVAWDLTRLVAQIRQLPMTVSDVVLNAAALRRGQVRVEAPRSSLAT